MSEAIERREVVKEIANTFKACCTCSQKYLNLFRPISIISSTDGMLSACGDASFQARGKCVRGVCCQRPFGTIDQQIRSRRKGRPSPAGVRSNESFEWGYPALTLENASRRFSKMGWTVSSEGREGLAAGIPVLKYCLKLVPGADSEEKHIRHPTSEQKLPNHAPQESYTP